MNNVNIQDLLKGIFAVLIGLAIVLIPFSIFIGWNLPTLLLFWFVVIPTLTIYLPTRVSKNSSHLLESVGGLTLFYGAMVFMIYEHYQTDYFLVMGISCFLNLALVALFTFTGSPKPQAE
jgi:hypothetical protein